MEKVIYALWRRKGETREMLNTRLRDETAALLLALPGVRGVRLNLQDEAVTRAAGLRQVGAQPQMDAAMQLWLEASHDTFRAPVDDILRACAGRLGAWLVLESTVIANRLYPPREGERTAGWSQFCFMQRPTRLTYDQWRTNWQDLHTQVAIETQANFEYVQNLVVRPLIEGAPPFAAIVEECFPTDAMDDPAVFFDAVGDKARFEANTRAMAQSCARFIDLEQPGAIDVLPTSQYEIRKAWEA